MTFVLDDPDAALPEAQSLELKHASSGKRDKLRASPLSLRPLVAFLLSLLLLPECMYCILSPALNNDAA